MPPTPKGILKDIKLNKISKADGYNKLISIVKTSEDLNIRKEALEILIKSNINKSDLIKVIEEIIFSDENSFLRNIILNLALKAYHKELKKIFIKT